MKFKTIGLLRHSLIAYCIIKCVRAVTFIECGSLCYYIHGSSGQNNLIQTIPDSQNMCWIGFNWICCPDFRLEFDQFIFLFPFFFFER